jgi:hypothetical protein
MPVPAHQHTFSALEQFSRHLLEFSKIRKEHDQIYANTFASPELRRSIESVGAEDRFIWHAAPDKAFRAPDQICYDPKMRQLCADGSRVVKRWGGDPRSRYLQEANLLINPVLDWLDQELQSMKLDCTDADVEAMVNKRFHDRGENSIKLLGKLGRLQQKLVSKQALTARELWVAIMANTDEMYEVVEELKPTFEAVMQALMLKAGLDPDVVAFTKGEGKEEEHVQALMLRSTPKVSSCLPANKV